MGGGTEGGGGSGEGELRMLARERWGVWRGRKGVEDIYHGERK